MNSPFTENCFGSLRKKTNASLRAKNQIKCLIATWASIHEFLDAQPKKSGPQISSINTKEFLNHF